jgi:hypothetical protein
VAGNPAPGILQGAALPPCYFFFRFTQTFLNKPAGFYYTQSFLRKIGFGGEFSRCRMRLSRVCVINLFGGK